MTGTSGLTLIYATCATRDEALSLGRALVEARLVACGSTLDGARSVYWWDGAVQDSAEAVLLCKTTPSLAEAATERLRALHSYDCPCVLALPTTAANPAFAAWVAAETVQP